VGQRDEEQLDIFVVGRDGSVFTNWVRFDADGDQWLNWNQWGGSQGTRVGFRRRS